MGVKTYWGSTYARILRSLTLPSGPADEDILPVLFEGLSGEWTMVKYGINVFPL